MSTLSDTEISNKKLAAGLTGVFLGAFGVHKFILGYTKPAVIMLVVCLAGGAVTCGVASFVMGVIGLIEGIIYLTKTTAEFQAEYIDAEKPWF
jgi:TM2 domain-containing membrane protein YozV